MIRLTETLNAWGTPGFEAILKSELERLDADQLPLQQGLTISNHVADRQHTVIVLRVTDADGFLHVKAGVFYSGVIAGCSCADDPTPVDEQNEYCEVQIAIHKQTAEASVTLLEN